MGRRPPRSTLFPARTLFRSHREGDTRGKPGEAAAEGDRGAHAAAAQHGHGAGAVAGEREGEAAKPALDLLGHHDLALRLITELACGHAAGPEAGVALRQADR